MATRPVHLAAPPESVDDDPLVTEVMTTRLIGIVPDAPLSTALHLMASAGVRHLPVLDGRRCLGLVVEADVVRYLAQAPGPFGDGSPMVVGDVCRAADPLAVRMRRSDAARRMEATGSDAVLVADDGRLVGIVTATDLIRSLAGRAAPEAADQEGR
ncbi:CBS domain-containing protein [Pseudonocardia bannensis]|uniref:CBS domain-containing protein n=1 Tax=Pseudonocardia bannensis TaxID=630973 RepID=A0A848DES6_9PSEU|nr:CBS domain-containing protein [Pseudonocardia bannensis]NMH91089.1 CBS domain-containing protein [Pseudonocardia bannensis]